MLTRHFAVFMPVLAKNTKLQYLSLSGNQLIDKVADVYDLFDIDGFNETIANKGKKKASAEIAVAKDKKGNPIPDDATKKKKPKIGIKLR